jgi:hypothetical protein
MMSQQAARSRRWPIDAAGDAQHREAVRQLAIAAAGKWGTLS